VKKERQNAKKQYQLRSGDNKDSESNAYTCGRQVACQPGNVAARWRRLVAPPSVADCRDSCPHKHELRLELRALVPIEEKRPADGSSNLPRATIDLSMNSHFFALGFTDFFERLLFQSIIDIVS